MGYLTSGNRNVDAMGSINISENIITCSLIQDDYNTLIPVVDKHIKAFRDILKEMTADSDYCSEMNRLYLKKHKIASYIKLLDHEQRKMFI